MKKDHFNRIAASLEDAIAYAKGDTTKGRVVAGPEVEANRAKTKLSKVGLKTGRRPR